jgi:hypothetical protein
VKKEMAMPRQAASVRDSSKAKAALRAKVLAIQAIKA